MLPQKLLGCTGGTNLIHPAELTAGYYNTNGFDGYAAIAKMCAQTGCKIDFTCLEMQDNEQDASCDCGPYELVQQVEHAAFSNGIGFVVKTLCRVSTKQHTALY